MEDKFYKAFLTSPDMVIITSLKDGKYTDVNDSFIQTTGYNREELIGHNVEEFSLFANPAEQRRMEQLLAEKGVFKNEEFDIRVKSGEIHQWLCSAEILDIDSDPCMIAVAADITEFKKVQQALRESESILAVAFRSSPHAIVIATMGDEKIIEANENAVRLTGYSREEIIGRTVRELKIWDDEVFRARIAKALWEKGRVSNEELEYLAKSGKTHNMLLSAEIADIGGQKCLVAFITDITDQKKIEKTLLKSEEKFTKAFRSSPGILSISRLSDGSFLEINDSFTRILGFTRKDIIGHTSLELGIWVNPADREKMIRLVSKNGRISNQEYLHRSKSGEILTFLFSAEQIEFDGEACILSFSNDVTEYKRIEAEALEVAKLRELDRLRTELLANVSHELRTPLASIKGFATMLMDYGKRLTAQEKREYLETIDKNTDRLVELIEQLLEMSRLGSGMLSIKKAPTNITNLCQTVINEVRVREPDHNYILDMPRKLPLMDIDERRIRQVLDNVINNAVKYSNTGTDITLSIRKTDNEMLFCVADHGIGIPESDLPRLFQRLFHTAQGQKAELHGAGLGLSICKGLIEAHGGKIWIESKQGVGTSCYFALPITPKPKRITKKTSK